ncbi:MAG: hypothetical protein CO141_04565 [Candidatus Moranbacteria bacterium CG_4_9_14_3_um_filter_42_9]|nr:MAG: hypothetical protein CO141_04565 [Candidatus Moranbacteria bacterium CG_4_9_14_3_um_filter_42_9]
MGKGNGHRFTLASGSAQFFECPRLVTTGSVSIEHLLEQRLYSRKNKKCQKCGVCEAYLMKAEPPQPNVVQITGLQRARKEVRPAKHNRLHHKTITKTVAVGMGRR